MIYLASPYSDPSRALREQRYEQVTAAAIKLAKIGFPVVSPIQLWHIPALTNDLPYEAEFWKAQNFGVLEKSDLLAILQLPRWQFSKGVQDELDFAIKNTIPVIFLHPEKQHKWAEQLLAHYPPTKAPAAAS